MQKKTFIFILALAMAFCLAGCSSVANTTSTNTAAVKTVSADDEIQSVSSYGFVDLEGAKLSAIIVDYKDPVDAASINENTYSITDYTILQEQASGYDSSIEMDFDSIKGNEGQITKVYVNDAPQPAEAGKASGRYVIIEVNTAYMLSGQNLTYTSSMIAGVTQNQPVLAADGTVITAGTKEVRNYTETQSQGYAGGGSQGSGNSQGGKGGPGASGSQSATIRINRTANKDQIILPEFGPGSGWTLNYIGASAFKATHCYSEYTGKYEDFELPYSIYVPDAKTMEANKGNISLVLHMEHAGSNDSDPMAAITSSRAAVKLSGKDVQAEHPAIVVVPQVEESRRSADDMVATSEVNTAVWELLDSLLAKYEGYINTEHIYGTGQSMGGMTILAMAAQRDNFFAGIAVVGAQWSNNYNKAFQHNGSPARSPENDQITFSSNSFDPQNYANWYYMVSDDNILVQTCSGDAMASGEWKYLKDYIEMAGGNVAQAEWDPYLPVDQQNALGKALLNHSSTAAGTGLNWAEFTRGTHMSTWKYGYRLDYPFEWLFTQNRATEMTRRKLTQLTSPWLGRNSAGEPVSGSGTAGMNSAQFTPNGASDVYVENWTPESVTK